MVKLRKQRKRKTYRFNVNRKRMRNKLRDTGKITCKEIKGAWDSRKSLEANLQNMGLSYDPNITVTAGQTELTPENNGKEWSDDACEDKLIPSRPDVAEDMEKEAKAPRERLLRLPNSQVDWITYLMKKYGTDYKAMTRDKKNHYQETWKQLRAKIKRFKSIPEQYSKYLEEHGLPDVQESISDDD